MHLSNINIPVLTNLEAPHTVYSVLYLDDNFDGLDGYTTEGWYFNASDTENSISYLGPFKDDNLAETAMCIWYGKL